MAERLRAVSFARGCVVYLLLAAWGLGTAALLRETLVVQAPWGLVDLSVALSPGGYAAFSLVYLLACGAFLLRRAELWTCVLLIAQLAALGLSEQVVRDDSMPPLATMLGSTMLGSWLAGLLIARHKPRPEREALGHELMCGTLAASFFLAGVAKLINAGPGWAHGLTHSMFIYERAASSWPFITELRLFVADHPTLCAAGAAYALFVESTAFIYVWPSARKLYGFMVLSMFAGMGLTLGLVEQGWEILPVALAYSTLADRRAGQAAQVAASPSDATVATVDGRSRLP